MSEISWAREAITGRYPDAIKQSGVDLDGNRKIEGSELLTDANHNVKIGDNEDFLAFLDRNNATLRQQIPFIGAALGSNSNEMKSDNRIHQLLWLESQVPGSEPRFQEAYDNLTSLIAAIKDELSQPGNQAKSIAEKIQVAFKVMTGRGYTLLKNNEIARQSFLDSLVNKKFDCDSSSFVILALADELTAKKENQGWKDVGLMNIPAHPRHTLLYINKDVFVEFGDVISRQDLKSRHIKVSNLDQILNNPLKGDKILTGFYTSLGERYVHLGNYVTALACYKKAIQLDPNNSDAYHNQGIVHDRQGDLVSALADYSRAIEIQPYHLLALTARTRLYELMALAAEKKGDTETSAKFYNLARKDYALAMQLFDGYSGQGTTP